MKKRRQKRLFGFGIIALHWSTILLAGTAIIFYPQQILVSTPLMAGLWLFVLLALCLPGSRKAIQLNGRPRYGLWAWLLRVLGIQLGFYLVWYQTSQVLLIATGLEEPVSGFMIGQLGTLLHTALYPWAFVFLYLFAMLLTSSGKIAKGSHFIRETFRAKISPTLLAIPDTNSTFSSIFCFLFPLAILSAVLFNILLLMLFGKSNASLFMNTQANLLTSVIGLVVLFNGRWLKSMKQRTQGQEHVFGVVWRCLIVYFVTIVVVQVALRFLPIPVQIFLFTPGEISWLFYQTPLQAWLLSNFMFLTAAVPLLSTWLYSISNGYRVTTLVGLLIIFPLFMAGILYVATSPEAWLVTLLGLDSVAWAVQITDLIKASHHILISLPLTLIAIGLICFVLRFNQTVLQSIIDITANDAGKKMKRLRMLFIKMSAIVVWSLFVFQFGGIFATQAVVTLMGMGAILFILLPILLRIVVLLYQALPGILRRTD